MKKLISLLFVFPIALCSCLNINNGGTRSPIEGGFDIYNLASPINIAAQDPVTVAMKLNALLTAYEDMGGGVPLDEIILENNQKMSDLLFGTDEATFTNIGGGRWRIAFKGFNAPVADYRRFGAIQIDTGEKLLQDLPGTGDVWTIENVVADDSEEIQYGIITDNWIGIVIRILSSDPQNSYVIAGGAENNTWNISGPKVMSYMINKQCYNTPYWGISYTLKQTSSDLSYEGLGKATFEMTGSASGNVPNYNNANDIFMTYEIESPLKTDNECKTINDWKGPYIYGGAIRITIDEPSYTDDFDKNLFPSNNTKWTWAMGSGQCQSITTVNYNGSSVASRETEE